MKESEQIFKRGSTTYSTASRFFPEDIRKDVTNLYAFVRTADDYVDSKPQQAAEFYNFWQQYEDGLSGKNLRTVNPIINRYIDLTRKKTFDPLWTEAFFHSMEMDLMKTEYSTRDELDEYINGSAKVIGLEMARILNLPRSANPAAEKLGEAMQIANHIRDINEDADFGRVYFPQNELRKHGLTKLSHVETGLNERGFRNFIQEQIIFYRGIEEEAKEGLNHLPPPYRIPVKTAADMYEWTIDTIAKDPFIVYERKVKPGKIRIIGSIIYNAATNINRLASHR